MFCCFVIFPSRVCTAVPQIWRALCASSGVNGQFQIRMSFNKSLNSCSDGLPIFRYRRLAFSASSTSRRVYWSLLLSLYGGTSRHGFFTSIFRFYNTCGVEIVQSGFVLIESHHGSVLSMDVHGIFNFCIHCDAADLADLEH